MGPRQRVKSFGGHFIGYIFNPAIIAFHILYYHEVVCVALLWGMVHIILAPLVLRMDAGIPAGLGLSR